jgi:nucleotide-binding universal stress UspA family protein
MFDVHKTIVVFMDTSPTGLRRARHALALAKRWDAHIVWTHLIYGGVALPPSMSYARGSTALQDVVQFRKRQDSEAMERSSELQQWLQDEGTSHRVSAEFQAIGREQADAQLISFALEADLLISGQPEPDGLSEFLTLEKVLLNSGVPLLIIPNAWDGKAIGNRVLIGWNSSRQVRRAVRDAMPLLSMAQYILMITVESQTLTGNQLSQGRGFLAYLHRRQIRPETEQVTADGRSVSAVLANRARQLNIDLLVVGAYSHARFKEAVFGGTTRELLARAPIPTLVAR